MHLKSVQELSKKLVEGFKNLRINEVEEYHAKGMEEIAKMGAEVEDMRNIIDVLLADLTYEIRRQNPDREKVIGFLLLHDLRKKTTILIEQIKEEMKLFFERRKLAQELARLNEIK